MKNVNRDIFTLSEAAGRDLLGSLVTELRHMPDVWQKLPKAKQDDIIERLRKQVANQVTLAVHAIASEERIVVTGAIDQITIKDGVKAVVKFGPEAANLDHLFRSGGKMVLLVVANAEDHMLGMDQIEGEDEQKILEFNKH